jgi:hypothetical protein
MSIHRYKVVDKKEFSRREARGARHVLLDKKLLYTQWTRQKLKLRGQ